MGPPPSAALSRVHGPNLCRCCVVLCVVSCVVLCGVVLCVVCCVVCCVYSCLPPSLPPYPSHLSLSTHASATPRTLLLSLDALRSGLSLLPQFLQPHTHTHRH